MRRVFSVALVLAVVAAATMSAAVKTQQKSQVKFAGALGGVVNFFGGKAAREGVVSDVAVSGDRKLTTTENSGQIIDLAEEKVYDLDLRKKTYTVTTFDEIRRKMQEAQAKAEKSAEKESKSKEPQKEYQVDVDVKDTGQRKTINGFACRQVITTITVHEKGKPIEQSGGLLLTADSWLTPTIAAMKEVLDFDRRYAEKLMGTNPQVAAEQMATALGMYPGLKDAMAKMQANSAKLDGTPIATTMTVDNVKTAGQAASEEKTSNEQPAASGGVGGVLGGFGRRIARKKDDQPQSGDKSRSTFMTINHEVLSVSTSVDASAVAMPAGFRQK